MLNAHYFDGRSTRVREVDLSVDSADLVIAGEEINIRIPFAQIQVDERLGRAPRRLRLPDGAFCEVRDLDALDRLLALTTHRDGWVDRMQRHLQVALISLVICSVLAVVAYRWGLPWAAAVGAERLPPAVGRALTTQTLKVLEGGILLPSTIPENRRQELSARFRQLRLPEGGLPKSTLLIRRSPQLKANALTLPDGTIIVLDDLITSIGNDQQIMAVLAHELGHAHGRHGLQTLLQSSAVAAFWSFYIGDISQLLAAAPAAMVQSRYTQDLERQADDYGAAVLLRNGMSPALLADALRKLTKDRAESSTGGFLMSHPSSDERMQHLRSLAN